MEGDLNPARRHGAAVHHARDVCAGVSLLLILVMLLVALALPGVSAAGPQVSIQSPSPGQTVYGTALVVSGTAASATSVWVTLEGMGQTLRENASTVSTWSVTFDLRPLPGGTYTLTAFATNGTSTVSDQRTLSLALTGVEILSVTQQYIEPMAGVLGIIIAGLVLWLPRWHALGDRTGATLCTLAFLAIVLQLLLSPFSLPLAAAGALLVVMVYSHYRRTPRGRGQEP